tara:strand:- start:622 stop:1806 length:1185 start_codon:yes stop_codon:yes gene_type:complete
MKLLIFLFIVQGVAILLSLFRLVSREIMTQVLRLSYGPFLIFSGSVKILDPLGFSYKLQEYFDVFGLEWMNDFTLSLSIFVCALEIILGVLLIYGLYVKKILQVNLVLIVGFTFLTFYSAYFNAVTDCGCFGDFMKLDPWFSFQKDVFFLVVSYFLLSYHATIKPIYSVRWLHRSLIIIVLFVFFIPFYGLSHLPMIDFRAYNVGSNIMEKRMLPEDAKQDQYEDVWYYEIDGVVQEFATSDNPWQIKGAKFIDRETKLIFKGDEPLIKDFDIIDDENQLNLTDSILSLKRVLLLISYDIEKTNIKGHSKIKNSILTHLKGTDIPIYGLSSSSQNDIKKILSKNVLDYPYFAVDQTTLKTIIRSNPGVIMLEKGVVTNKWHWRDIPEDWSSYIK